MGMYGERLGRGVTREAARKYETSVTERARRERWQASGCARVVSRKYGTVVVPHGSNFAALLNGVGAFVFYVNINRYAYFAFIVNGVNSCALIPIVYFEIIALAVLQSAQIAYTADLTAHNAGSFVIRY